jgi:hypothetical protein
MKLDGSVLREKHLQDKSFSNEQDRSVSKKLKIEASGEEISKYSVRSANGGSISRRNLKCPARSATTEAL